MKPENRKLLEARAESAVRAMYHNATPTYPRDFGAYAERFNQWFDDAARFEIEYLCDGGAYGRDYRKTLLAPCNAGKYKSERAREYYVRKGMRDMAAEREHCGTRADGTRNNALWEYISDYGELYQHGRGGRTLAPADLWRENGCGHGAKFDAAEHSAEWLTRLIQIVESFNRHVSDWCDGVPEMWREQCAEWAAEEKAEAKAARKRAKEAKRTAYLTAAFVGAIYA